MPHCELFERVHLVLDGTFYFAGSRYAIIIRDVSLNDVSHRACVSSTDYYKTRVSSQQKIIFISFVIKANFEKHGFMA